MKKLYIVLLAAILTLVLASCGTDAEVGADFATTLDAPAGVTSDATGSATAELEGDVLTVNGSFSDLSSPLFEVMGSSVHVHNAAAGGAIVFGLQVEEDVDLLGGTFSGEGTLSAEQLVALENGQLYINVHTETYTGGEIRGDLEAVE